MKITLNGTEIMTEATTVSALIEEQGFKGKPVIVEYNKSALVASAYLTTELSEGDSIQFFVLGAGG